MNPANKSTHVLRSSIATLALLLLGTSGSHAATFVFWQGDLVQNGTTVSTSYVDPAVSLRSGYSNQNSDGRLLVGQNGGNGSNNSVISFDLSAIKTAAAGQTIQINSVSLTLTVQGLGTGTVLSTYKLDLLGDGSSAYGFNETTATWAAPGGSNVAGGTLGTNLSNLSFNAGSQTVGQLDTWASTSAFTTAVSNALSGDGTLRLILTSTNVGVNSNVDLARFWANDAGTYTPTTAEHPYLSVDYTLISVPEPSSFVLVAVSGLALLALRRKTQKA